MTQEYVNGNSTLILAFADRLGNPKGTLCQKF